MDETDPQDIMRKVTIGETNPEDFMRKVREHSARAPIHESILLCPAGTPLDQWHHFIDVLHATDLVFHEQTRPSTVETDHLVPPEEREGLRAMLDYFAGENWRLYDYRDPRHVCFDEFGNRFVPCKPLKPKYYLTYKRE